MLKEDKSSHRIVYLTKPSFMSEGEREREREREEGRKEGKKEGGREEGREKEKEKEKQLQTKTEKVYHYRPLPKKLQNMCFSVKERNQKKGKECKMQ